VPIRDRTILGRDPAGAHVVFPETDMSVSRRHCEIVYNSTAMVFELRDLGSRNGTFIVRNDGPPRRLAPDVAERVAPGAKVLVGSTTNSLVLEVD
jgi:pSer/pThr/pTyr-binding forkhead associated (FHA) protein